VFSFRINEQIMASASEDDVMDAAEDSNDDLFGEEDEVAPERVRELSDRELDSGDDEGRYDRAEGKLEAEEVDSDSGRFARIQETTIWRHPLPKPVDGEVRSYLLEVFRSS
jgi:RNA polymerase-associated protein LEO1